MYSHVSFDVDGRTLVVTPAGHLDLHESLGLRSALIEACRHNLPVVVDMSKVTAVDAAALGVLVSAHRQLHSTGCHLMLTHASARVRRALHLTGLDRVLWVQDGEA